MVLAQKKAIFRAGHLWFCIENNILNRKYRKCPAWGLYILQLNGGGNLPRRGCRPKSLELGEGLAEYMTGQNTSLGKNFGNGRRGDVKTKQRPSGTLVFDDVPIEK